MPTGNYAPSITVDGPKTNFAWIDRIKQHGCWWIRFFFFRATGIRFCVHIVIIMVYVVDASCLDTCKKLVEIMVPVENIPSADDFVVHVLCRSARTAREL